jgi:hypothetical protein
MPEIKNYTFQHTELTEILIKNLGLHQGLWGTYIEFGLAAANIPTGPDPKSIMPAGVSVVQKIGIQRFEEPNNLTVDAAVVNPAVTKKKR